MIAQIFAVVIFITMFVFIVTEIVERHIVSLISALLTMIFVFGIGMQSMEAIWETLNISSIFRQVSGMRVQPPMEVQPEYIGKLLYLFLV